MILTNQSDKPLQGTLLLYDLSGKSWNQPLQLTAKQTQRLSVRQLIDAAGLSGTYGGIKVEMPSGAGSIDTAHIIYDEVAGFSATLKMFDFDPRVKLESRDFAEKGSWITRAPMLALTNPDPVLAFPKNTALQPLLLLRNTTSKQIKANLTFHWRNASKDGRAVLPEMTLSPYETRKIDVLDLQNRGTIPLDAYWAQVTLMTNTLPDEVMAIAASYDSTLRYGAQTPFSDQLIGHLEGGEWQVDSTHTSLIAAGNGGGKPTKAALTLLYDQGRKQYRVEQTIGADDQWWVDIGQLIRNQIPDANGNVLPANLTVGAYQLKEVGSPAQNVLYEGKVITDKTFGHATYGCMVCCGYNGSAMTLIEDPTFVDIAATNYVDVYATNACSGSNDPVTGYFPTWTSLDTSKFTAQVAAITGVGAGRAVMRTSAYRLPWGDGEDTRLQCPVASPQGSGTGNVTQTTINSANLWSNQISVTLSGDPGNSGNLTITLVGAASSYSFQYSGNPVGPGTYTVSMNRPSIPADNYTSIRADWDPGTATGTPSTGVLGIHWRVLGVIRHSQYNVPYESACTGAPANSWIIVPSQITSQCQFTPITLKSDFVSQVYINGTGMSNGNGILKYTPGNANQCAYPAGSDDSNTFLQVGSVTGSCNVALDTTSVATYPNPKTDTTTFGCGDNLQLITGSNTQQALKYPEDYCPSCNGDFRGTNGHIDNFSSSQSCTGRGVGDYGNFWTADTYDQL